MDRSATALLLWSLGSLGAASPALASDPRLATVRPKGATRGAEVKVTLGGERLGDAVAVLCGSPGLSFGEVAPKDAKAVDVVVRVAPDCDLGEHFLRLRTRTGITGVQTFWVGPFPTGFEAEPNDDADQANSFALDTTIEGTIRREDVDHFAFDLAPGARFSVEIEAMRLGESFVDPLIEVRGPHGRVVAGSDDSDLWMQDASVSFVVEEAGRHVVSVRDATWFGDGAPYRLHAGRFPRPRVVYPPGGRPGETLEIRFIGDPTGPVTRSVTLPKRGVYPFGLYLGEDGDEDGASPPSWNVFRLIGLDNVLEVEPNGTRERATTTDRSGGLALNGIIEPAGDADWFSLSLKNGEPTRLRVLAQFVQSPLDGVLELFAPDGRRVAENDDSGGPDSRIDYTPKEDGHYWVRVRDLRGRGGPEFVYRVEVTPIRPSLSFFTPRFGRDSQARQHAPVPRGGRYASTFRVSRDGFDDDVRFEARALPDGVRMIAPNVPKGTTTIPVVFEADADAPSSGSLCDLLAYTTTHEPRLAGRYRQTVELVVAPPNRTVYYRQSVPSFPVAVTEATPFSVDLVPPSTPLVQGGVLDVEVRVTRANGFEGPVQLRRVWLSAGVGSPSVVTVKEGETTAKVRLDARDDAAVGEFPLVWLGEATVDGGVLLASTGLEALTVAPPYVTGKITLAAIERGGRAELVCRLEQRVPFDGKATAHLLNLPPRVQAPPREVSSTDAQIVFDVTAEEAGPTGRFAQLLCEIVVDAGGPIRHRTAQGGVLRVDPHGTGGAAGSPNASGAAPSRLEQLRAEARGAEAPRQ